MQITNLLESSNPKYKGLYGINYFGDPDGHGNLLRSEDQWPALCYMHGIYDPPDLDIKPEGKTRDEFLKLLSDQINFLKINQKRTPRSVLEIGSGSGQVSCTLSHMGYSIQSTDVNPHAGEFHQARAIDMYNNKIADDYHILLGDLTSVAEKLNLENVDTVLLIESIEHIYNDEWQNFLKLALPSFKKNHTHLIITNFQDWWPIGGMDGEEHCNTIDDVFFDQLTSFSNKVLFRDRAHLVLEF